MANSKLFLVILITFGVIVPSLVAHIAEFDGYWRRRAEESLENTHNLYHPEPEKVTAEVNKAVVQSLKEVSSNTTARRLLGSIRKNRPCEATNPIDKCWRCDPKWADNRKRLADCGIGFGKNATGGKHGEFYVVTDDSDDTMNPKIGTLRHAVTQKRPLWIIFQRDMVIRLVQELIMESDKTIDARGTRVYITGGAGLTLQFIRNVIIHGLRINNIGVGSGGLIRDSEEHFGLRTQSDGDGISIFGSQNIWIDHVSMKKCFDGIIDVIEGSTAITISNGHFTDHNEVMLFGAHDNSTIDEKMQITLAFNHFGKRLVQRMPRCRFGYVHIVNNDYTHWNMYAIGGSSHPTIISQGNRFVASNDAFTKEVTKREAVESVWKNWDWVSEDNLFVNGAYFVPSGDQDWSRKHPQISDGVKSGKGIEASILTKYSGALRCIVGKPC
ncbi:lyase [Lithospermum erythrorhizon]|uniref:Pectate lyase n=1 Tax=Lithospermum erythrorhizon TaxID=34254 RepID=A0AAV3RXG1_LITER